MPTWKLVLEYDGSKYSGWQEQINARTIAGELRKAAEDLLGPGVDIQGAGRTDAGVHALGQVAHLRVRHKVSRPPSAILSGLNERLPSTIVVLELTQSPDRFHARHDALTRVYLYQITTRKTAFAKRYSWWVKEALDVPSMATAAAMLTGRHDFARFRAPDPSRPEESTIVVVESAEIGVDEDMIVFRIGASHFLWRMVRRLTGVLVKLGKNEITLHDFEELLRGKARPGIDVAAWTAPASGLFLESVRYEATTS